jgi:alkaline phosphatase
VQVTSRLSHATPAAFSAHASSRYEETDITRQQILLRPDVMFGGIPNLSLSDFLLFHF